MRTILKEKLICLVIILLVAQNVQASPSAKRYAVLIGVNDYLDQSILKLNTPRNDANDLAICLNNSGWDKVFIMTDDSDARSEDFPTRRNIEKRINLLAELANPSDTIFLFFSGHGMSSEGNEYFMPVDADLSQLKQTSLSITTETEMLVSKKITKIILAIDACRESMSITKGLSVVGINGGNQRGNTMATLYATKDGWYSYEHKDGRNSVFTKYLIMGLEGAASGASDGSQNGIVTISDIIQWLPDSVALYSLNSGIRQKPITTLYQPDAGKIEIGKKLVGNKQDDKNYLVNRTKFVYLSDQKISYETPIFIKDKISKTTPLYLNNKKYLKGLVTHAPATITVELNENYLLFESEIGLFDAGYKQSRLLDLEANVDDWRGEEGDVTYQVYNDDKLVFDSGKMIWSDEKFISIPVTGVRNLKLLVLPGESIHSDIAIWADAKLFLK